jgi:hypothetical protein
MAIKWLEEVVGNDQDEQCRFLRDAERHNDDYRAALLLPAWRPQLEEYIFNIFLLGSCLPYGAEVTEAHTSWAQDADVLTRVFMADHIMELQVTSEAITISDLDELMVCLCCQLGWLGDTTAYPQWRYSSDGDTWSYRPVNQLFQAGVQFFTLQYWESQYQSRLPGGF